MSERMICIGSLLDKGQMPMECRSHCPLGDIARMVTKTIASPGVDLVATLEKAHKESQDQDNQRREFAQQILDDAGGIALAKLVASNPRRSVTECPLFKRS